MIICRFFLVFLMYFVNSLYIALLSKLSSGWSINTGILLSENSNINFNTINAFLPGDICLNLSP